jgi:class 3 adenylate cyclase
MGCGGWLTSGERAGLAPASPPASLESYTPRHLAETILASRDALDGEPMQVTVLLADVVGSKERIQGLA